MRHLALVAMLTAVSVQTGSGATEEGNARQMAGSAVVGTKDHPEVVRVGTCSGVFVSPDWVLTAKHCIGRYRPSIQSLGGEVTHGIQRVHAPDGADLTLVKVEHRLKVEIATLIDPRSFEAVIRPGTGLLVTSGGLSLIQDRQEIDTAWAKVTPCRTRSVSLCVTQGSHYRSETGDSGGGVFFYFSPGEKRLVGIHVGYFELGTYRESRIIPVTEHLDWIHSIIGKNTPVQDQPDSGEIKVTIENRHGHCTVDMMDAGDQYQQRGGSFAQGSDATYTFRGGNVRAVIVINCPE